MLSVALHEEVPAQMPQYELVAFLINVDFGDPAPVILQRPNAPASLLNQASPPEYACCRSIVCKSGFPGAVVAPPELFAKGGPFFRCFEMDLRIPVAYVFWSELENSLRIQLRDAANEEPPVQHQFALFRARISDIRPKVERRSPILSGSPNSIFEISTTIALT